LGLALDEPNGNEVPTKVNGLDVLIADKVKGFADGSTVDYIQSPHGEGFAINNGKSGC
jgi:Fe-S cluster assembly iron-binding protein IscA